MNNIELVFLRYLLVWENYQKYRSVVNLKQVKEESRELFHIFSLLDELIQSLRKDITVEDLRIFVIAKTEEKEQSVYLQILTNLENQKVAPEAVGMALRAWKERDLHSRIAVKSYDLSQGRGKPEELQRLWDEYRSLDETEEGLSPKLGIKEVSEDIEAILDAQFSKRGLRWPLDCLNKALGSLRKGDFGFVFARPESGKTTFISHVATHMATQTELPVIWINNEEQGEKVRIRLVQSQLGLTTDEIKHARSKDPEGFKKAVIESKKAPIRLFDDSGISKTDVERILDSLENREAALIIIDQIDKIQGFDADRDDLRLGTIYQWAREIAKKHGPVIAVCQADGSGEDEKWLTMGNVANAKTSKQAEADFIIGIGKIHNDNYERTRFLNISKNKLIGDDDHKPELRHGKFQVVIQPEIARYKDIMEY